MTKTAQIVEALRAGEILTVTQIAERFKLARPWDTMSHICKSRKGIMKVFTPQEGTKDITAYYIPSAVVVAAFKKL